MTDDNEQLDENEKYLNGIIVCLENILENGTDAHKSCIVKKLKQTEVGDIIMLCSHNY